jgi:NADPH-dependent curcumin reductase CurA
MLIVANVVGGEILDMALSRAKPHARFVMCGGTFSTSKNPTDHHRRHQSIQHFEPSRAKGETRNRLNRSDVHTNMAQNYLMIVTMRIRFDIAAHHHSNHADKEQDGRVHHF